MIRTNPERCCFISVIMFVFLLILPQAFAGEEIVFGPDDYTISFWHMNLSRRTFQVDSPGDGFLEIKKNTPDKTIRAGFIIFNWRFIPLQDFLKGDDLEFLKGVKLKSHNHLTVFLMGTPSASIKITIRSVPIPSPEPEITFSVDPLTLSAGESSTLSWVVKNADMVNIDQGVGDVSPSDEMLVTPLETTTYTLVASGSGGTASASVTITVMPEPPTVEISADPKAIIAGESSTISWVSTDAYSCVIEPGLGTVNTSGSMTVTPEETTTYVITATGPGGSISKSIEITVSPPPVSPSVIISTMPLIIQKGESSTLAWTSVNAEKAHIDNGIGDVPPEGTVSVFPTATTTYEVSVTGPQGSASAEVTVSVLGSPAPLPENSFGRQYEDLIPIDATVDEYAAQRFSLITGLVRSIEGSPITDVSVTLHGHPEYGTASTDDLGRFSLPVEGGTTLTVVYQKDGFITSHRKVYVPWNDIAVAETVRLIARDPRATTVVFDGNPETVMTHQSTEISDEFGNRSATVVFTGDNQAYLMDENGNDVYELTAITTRATEFAAPESMPAKLPPKSAYTYCAELSVDGAQRVRFEKPVTVWVNNFLGFGVGEIVPQGYYDRDGGAWVPSDNGVVVKLLDTDSDGMVDALDADGDDRPDDLNGNGSLRDEVKGLDDSAEYPPGGTFWRVTVTHFTPWDFNWPYGPPLDWITPNPGGTPTVDQQLDEQSDCRSHTSSFVEERSRIFHEDISIPGTEMTLHYASNRVKGSKTNLSVPASGETVPASLKSIVVRLEVAGRTFEQILDPLPNQKAEFIWDGQNYLGRHMNAATAHISLGFVYDMAYYSAYDMFAKSFAQAGDRPTLIRGRQDMISWKHSSLYITREEIGTIAEGWSLSPHHYLRHNKAAILYKGNGSVVKDNAKETFSTVAGGRGGYCGDGGPATQACLQSPEGVTMDAAGILYISDTGNARIRMVDTEGTITTIAGGGNDFYGNGIPATEAGLFNPADSAVDSAGSLYFSDIGYIRKVDTDGIITAITTMGPILHEAYGITMDVEGNFFIADWLLEIIWKVNTNGASTFVAGNGSTGFSGDGGLAVEAQINCPRDVVLDLDGNLYLSDSLNHRIRKVDTSGIITTVAGSSSDGGYSGDGGLATQAELSQPHGLALDSKGNLFIVDRSNKCVRKVSATGIITTVAAFSNSSDPVDVCLDPLDNLYVADKGGNRILKIYNPPVLSYRSSEEDFLFVENGLGYIVSKTGLHQATVNLDTGVALYEFGYDQNQDLILVFDQFGNQTIINRDDYGVPVSIVSPDGLRTRLAVDGNNHLTRVIYPDDSFYTFEYTPDGLLTAKIEPEGNRFDHSFDSGGKLKDATDEAGGHWNYTRNVDGNGHILAEVTTGEENMTSYLDQTDAIGTYTSIITDPSGAETFFTRSADELTATKVLPCGMNLEFLYGLDDRYKYKYIKEIIEETPGGLQKMTTKSKIYQDTNGEGTPDLVTYSAAVNGKTTELVHNTLLAQKTFTSPEGRTVTTVYDPANLLTTGVNTPGLFGTNYGYDSRGRLTSIHTNTREILLSYNSLGFLESITDPENHITTYEYDPVGRLTALHRPDTSDLFFDYDYNGNMVVLTNPVSIDHRFGYNKVNLQDHYQTPISGNYSYLFDKDRRLVQTTFPSGKQINNIYDKTQLVQVQTPEESIDFTYLCGDKVDAVSKGAESINYGYDGKLITSESLSGTIDQSLEYTYNDDFNVIGFFYAGENEAYAYDKDGLLTASGEFTITRNAQNGLPEAVSGGTLSLTRNFNGYGELDGQAETINSKGLYQWNLIRDNNGRITQKTEILNSVTNTFIYKYDSMGRLLTVYKDGTVVEQYQYDLNGARISDTNTLRGISGRSMSYSDEDHLLTAGDEIYNYDLDGFLTTKKNGSGTTSYAYSTLGELLNVVLPDGTLIEYMYDPLGRRIAKKADGTVIEKYLWQGLTRLLAVYDGNDNLLMRFEYADGRMPVSMTRSDGTYYLIYDQVGSLRLAADWNGNPVKIIDYDSFGNIINDSDPSFTVPFGFAGGLKDSDTGLLRFGYRDYDPDVGRWTAKDPILFAGGDTDLYGYCINDPVNFIDSKGLISRGNIIDWSGTVITAIARECGFIGPKLATGSGIVTSVLGELVDPRPLNVGEEGYIEHYHTMQELGELEVQIAALQRSIEPMLKKLNIPYEWNSNFYYDKYNNPIPCR